MTKPSTAESFEERILEKLRLAGARGLPKAKLGTIRAGSNQARSLDQLVKSGAVVRLGSERGALYFLREAQPTHDSVSVELHEHLVKLGGQLFTASELAAKLKNSRKQQLIKEVIASDFKKLGLAPFKRKSTVLFAYLPETVKNTALGALDEAAVLRSFRELKNETGFSDIHISALAKRSGANLNSLHEYLLDLARNGKVMLSEGDWNASPDHAKQAVLEARGKRFLMARLLS